MFEVTFREEGCEEAEVVSITTKALGMDQITEEMMVRYWCASFIQGDAVSVMSFSNQYICVTTHCQF